MNTQTEASFEKVQQHFEKVRQHEEKMRKHRQLVGAIATTNITEVIEELLVIYQKLHDAPPYKINCGQCEDFAIDVIEVLANGAQTENLCMLWHDDMVDCTEDEEIHWAHCFIVHNDRFYDSEAPKGVDNWRDLPVFQNNGNTPNNHRTEFRSITPANTTTQAKRK